MPDKIWVKNNKEVLHQYFKIPFLSDIETNKEGSIIKGYDSRGNLYQITSSDVFLGMRGDYESCNRSETVSAKDLNCKATQKTSGSLNEGGDSNGIISEMSALEVMPKCKKENARAINSFEKKIWVKDKTRKINNVDVSSLFCREYDDLGEVVRGINLLGAVFEKISEVEFHRRRQKKVWVKCYVEVVDESEVPSLLSKKISESGEVIKGADSKGNCYEKISTEALRHRKKKINQEQKEKTRALLTSSRYWVKNRTFRLQSFNLSTLIYTWTSESGEIIRGYDKLGNEYELIDHAELKSRLLDNISAEYIKKTNSRKPDGIELTVNPIAAESLTLNSEEDSSKLKITPEDYETAFNILSSRSHVSYEDATSTPIGQGLELIVTQDDYEMAYNVLTHNSNVSFVNSVDSEFNSKESSEEIPSDDRAVFDMQSTCSKSSNTADDRVKVPINKRSRDTFIFDNQRGKLCSSFLPLLAHSKTQDKEADVENRNSHSTSTKRPGNKKLRHTSL